MEWLGLLDNLFWYWGKSYNVDRWTSSKL